MSKMPDRFNRLHFKIRSSLNASCARTDTRINQRLFIARQEALARYSAKQHSFITSAGEWVLSAWHDYARPVAAAVVLLLGLAVANMWWTQEQASEREEIDSALLVDDIPLGAYLDHGFEAWLADQN